jgi:hypothetical protein
LMSPRFSVKAHNIAARHTKKSAPGESVRG